MYLGIDLGTSGVRALLIDEEQRVIGTGEAGLEVSRPRPGWAEQDPGAWVRAAEDALDALATDHGGRLAAVRGIGLSGQMHGATLIDANDRALRPCILWNDTRSHAEAARLDADPRFRAISGNIVFPGFTAPKLVWVAAHETEIFARTARVLLPKDYLRLWLTGERVSEMSDASGTSWLDTGNRRWSEELLAATGLGPEQVPRLVEGSEASGALRAELAARWGMRPGVVVAGGAGDNAASAVGTGAISDGAAFLSLGTSGVLFAATSGHRPAPESAVHAFCHALPGAWHQMGVILSASAALEWLARITGTPVATLSAELGETLAPPGQVTFLPYLSGERTPHNDPAIRGVFDGIGHETDRTDLTRAVLEGVAYALRDNLDALGRAGTRLSRVTMIGGGSRSRYWTRLIATVLGLPVDIPARSEFGAVFGAARLGMMAATGRELHIVSRPPDIAATIQPNDATRVAFAERHARFQALYSALRPLSQERD